jgi:hypothetical protein
MSGFGSLRWRGGRGRPAWSSRWRAGGRAGGLVVLVRVEGEFAEQFAGGGVDDADVEVLDEEQDVGAGVGPADADVVELAVVAQGDDAGVVDVRRGAHIRPGLVIRPGQVSSRLSSVG